MKCCVSTYLFEKDKCRREADDETDEDESGQGGKGEEEGGG